MYEIEYVRDSAVVAVHLRRFHLSDAMRLIGDVNWGLANKRHWPWAAENGLSDMDGVILGRYHAL